MDVPAHIRDSSRLNLKTIEMHTTGEPTRIVYSGYPDLTGTLLEQRAKAKAEHDHIRRALICEPRGHREMYGAVLRPRTELTESGEAHIGVLFLTNEGYSTMCGHATLAVSRLLVDDAGSRMLDLFSLNGGNKLKFDEDTQSVLIRLHCPCGLVEVTVPTLPISLEKWKTDTSRPISYVSIPSYATGISVKLDLPPQYTWPEVAEAGSVVVDIAYGGAFYMFVTATALGYASFANAAADLTALNEATRKLKVAFNRPEASDLRKRYLRHPEHEDLQFLYSVFVTDAGEEKHEFASYETGLCFFANQQIDRSPTGSGVQARVALAYAKGQRKLGEQRTYHSLVSRALGEGAFVGEPVEEVDFGGIKAVTVKVSGYARYTGSCNFVVEENDRIGEGFWFDEL